MLTRMEGYHNKRFKDLEMEEQAHVRRLVREGKARLDRREADTSMRTVTYVVILSEVK